MTEAKKIEWIIIKATITSSNVELDIMGDWTVGDLMNWLTQIVDQVIDQEFKDPEQERDARLFFSQALIRKYIKNGSEWGTETDS